MTTVHLAIRPQDYGHPPTIENPTPGQQVPVGDQCPHCGVLKSFWLYNPFVRQGKETNGWLLWRSSLCRCSEPKPAAPRPDPELRDLDRLLNRERYRLQTFAAFPETVWRKALPAYRFCVQYAHRMSETEPQQGVCLWGPPSEQREYLLAAVVNAARARGVPAALITFPHLLSLLAVTDDPEAFQPAKSILRRIPHLAISGLFADPATPLELKPLHRLLDERLRMRRTTHMTLHQEPRYWRTNRGREHPITAEISLVAESLTLAPVAVPE